MATVSRQLPARPHLDVPKREASALLKEWRAGSPAALDRVRRRHPKFRDPAVTVISPGQFRLNDAQLVIAREYGFSNWAELKRRIGAHGSAGLLQEAIQRDDRETAVQLLRTHPELLHIPLWSGNW